MVSKSSDSTSKLKKAHGEQMSETFGTLSYKIHQLKKQIQVERVASVKEKLEKNGRKLETHVSHVLVKHVSSVEDNGSGNVLSSRIITPLCKYSGFAQGSVDKDCANGQEVLFSTCTKLPYTEKIPPYTTWVFLDRNQRMAEDQSVVGRRRIYYDQYGSEALICSDSEEEIVEPEKEKRQFSESEDRILWMTFQEHGLSEEVVNIMSQFIGGTTSDVQERYNTLNVKYGDNRDQKGSGDMVYEKSRLLDKSLSAALDSFDNLFCRRCLVFDCRLHGCSQNLINPTEKLSGCSELERAGKPCGDQCYLQSRLVKELPEDACSSEAAGKALSSALFKTTVSYYENMGKRKVLKDTNTMLLDSELISDDIQYSVSKKQKKLSVDVVSVSCKDISVLDGMSNAGDEARDVTEVPEKQQSSNIVQGHVGELGGSGWKPIEEELYLKGVEIFGKNSCLIARNLLSGLKTCMEVSSYMHGGGAAMPHRPLSSNSFVDDNRKAVTVHTEQEMPIRSRLFRKRGRTRKLKYSWKSSGHPSVWKRIADGKNQSCKQYTPCGCQSMCGKDCPCLQNETCCEKYCGCSKSCKNRFRGCHCAKSQCRSRQCPCFAARRECDPDVCRNCWVSCGDGTLGEPPRRGESQCGNMRLLLRQQQKILLSKSDVAGWGAFIKSPVNKNDYLGEYTGEIISHREADKRGKIYDRANSSFLFDLNDQYCLDAYRKGDKLKFANHSSKPNCYAKVMLVAGDHRVGIFAKEHIDASEELFYDYCYGPDQAPPWAKKPEGSNREDSTVSQGRAKKHQSHS